MTTGTLEPYHFPPVDRLPLPSYILQEVRKAGTIQLNDGAATGIEERAGAAEADARERERKKLMVRVVGCACTLADAPSCVPAGVSKVDIFRKGCYRCLLSLPTQFMSGLRTLSQFCLSGICTGPCDDERNTYGLLRYTSVVLANTVRRCHHSERFRQTRDRTVGWTSRSELLSMCVCPT